MVELPQNWEIPISEMQTYTGFSVATAHLLPDGLPSPGHSILIDVYRGEIKDIIVLGRYESDRCAGPRQQKKRHESLIVHHDLEQSRLAVVRSLRFFKQN